MRRLLIVILSLSIFCLPLEAKRRWIPKASASFQTASDNFNYSNGALLGSQTNWTNVDATSQMTVAVNGSAKGVYATSGGNNSVVFYNQLTWSANQYAQATIINVNGMTINQTGVAVRCSTTSGGNAYYTVYDGGGTIYVNKCNSGTHAGITTLSATLAIGDTVKLSVTGSGSSTRLNVYVNGVLQGAGNIDPGGTYISSGSPGISGYDTASGFACLGTWSASEQ